MKNICLILSLLFLSGFINSCSSSWLAYPDDVQYRMCDPYSDEALQMLFIPGYHEAVIIVEDCSLFRRQKVAIALQNFELAWSHHFGEDPYVFRNLRNLAITFSSAKKMQMGYSADGSFTTNGLISGSTLSKETIWIYTPPSTMRICETSLIHELVHASLWVRNGHGDPDHTGAKFFGWSYKHYALIDQVNRYLCVLGI